MQFCHGESSRWMEGAELFQTLPTQTYNFRYPVKLTKKRPHHPATTFATASQRSCIEEASQRFHTSDTQVRSTLCNGPTPRRTAPHIGSSNSHLQKAPPNQRVAAQSPFTHHVGQSQLRKGMSWSTQTPSSHAVLGRPYVLNAPKSQYQWDTPPPTRNLLPPLLPR